MTKRKRAPVAVSRCTSCGKVCDDATGVTGESSRGNKPSQPSRNRKRRA